MIGGSDTSGKRVYCHKCGSVDLDPPIAPIPMLLWCPGCHERHIDTGEFATTKHHHTHACQSCGFVWRPALVNTVGVQFLPGFRQSLEDIKKPVVSTEEAQAYQDLLHRVFDRTETVNSPPVVIGLKQQVDVPDEPAAQRLDRQQKCFHSWVTHGAHDRVKLAQPYCRICGVYK